MVYCPIPVSMNCKPNEAKMPNSFPYTPSPLNTPCCQVFIYFDLKIIPPFQYSAKSIYPIYMEHPFLPPSTPNILKHSEKELNTKQSIKCLHKKSTLLQCKSGNFFYQVHKRLIHISLLNKLIFIAFLTLAMLEGFFFKLKVNRKFTS